MLIGNADINNLDDPFVPGKIIPYSQNIIIATKCYGEHLGPWKLGSLIAIVSFLIKYWRGIM